MEPEPNDFDGVAAKALGLNEAVVGLRSIGGSILPGMAAGREVRRLDLTTEAGESCDGK
jgi:hypothetical protein